MSEPTAQMKALQSAPFFADLPPEDLDGILKVGQPVSFISGETLVEQGAVGDAMYLITAGVAEVDVGGRFHRLGPGEFFGEMALISQGKRMATVKATEAVEALRIPVDAFQSFLLDHPSVAISMMKALVARLREVEQRIDAWMAT